MTIKRGQRITLIERKANRERKTRVIDTQDRYVVVRDIEQAWFTESFLLVDVENDIHPFYRIKID